VEEQVVPFLSWYFIFIVGIACHEGAHAWTAWKLGDPTAYEGGQATINPIPHMQREPFGTILLPILGFFGSGFLIGYAWVPVDPIWAMRYPRRSAVVSLAGPAATLVLAVAAFIGIKIGVAAGVFEIPDFREGGLREIAERGIVVGEGTWGNAARLLGITYLLQGILFFFNLLPFPPLDGSGVVTLFMSRENALRFRQFAREWSMAGMVGAIVLFYYYGWYAVVFLVELAR
jgi:Zn-dependent protease